MFKAKRHTKTETSTDEEAEQQSKPNQFALLPKTMIYFHP